MVKVLYVLLSGALSLFLFIQVANTEWRNNGTLIPPTPAEGMIKYHNPVCTSKEQMDEKFIKRWNFTFQYKKKNKFVYKNVFNVYAVIEQKDKNKYCLTTIGNPEHPTKENT